MSSGRDVWMESWSQEDKQHYIQPKTHLQRMKEYKETLEEELHRIENHIKELEKCEINTK